MRTSTAQGEEMILSQSGGFHAAVHAPVAVGGLDFFPLRLAQVILRRTFFSRAADFDVLASVLIVVLQAVSPIAFRVVAIRGLLLREKEIVIGLNIDATLAIAFVALGGMVGPLFGQYLLRIGPIPCMGFRVPFFTMGSIIRTITRAIGLGIGRVSGAFLSIQTVFVGCVSCAAIGFACFGIFDGHSVSSITEHQRMGRWQAMNSAGCCNTLRPRENIT